MSNTLETNQDHIYPIVLEKIKSYTWEAFQLCRNEYSKRPDYVELMDINEESIEKLEQKIPDNLRGYFKNRKDKILFLISRHEMYYFEMGFKIAFKYLSENNTIKPLEEIAQEEYYATHKDPL